jgi:polyphosphate kinase
MNEAENQFINRDLSWLEFNARVLSEAMESTNAIFERLKFIGIVSSNFDEFFMVRVSELQASNDPTLQAVRKKAYALMQKQNLYFQKSIILDLKKIGIERVSTEKLSKKNKHFLQTHFQNELLPHLKIIELSGSEPSSLIDNLAVYSLFRYEQKYFAIRLEEKKSRFVFLPTKNRFPFVLAEDVIQLFSEQLFGSGKLLQLGQIRITRNANFDVDEDSFPETFSKSIELRTRGFPIRVEASASLAMIETILKIPREMICSIPTWCGLQEISQMINEPRFRNFKQPNWIPKPHLDFEKTRNIWTLLKEKDFYLHHPYDSFDPVVRFLQDAAVDPLVLEIKQTLYRTDHHSAIIAALEKAARNGKRVTVLVEIKARFDEEKNMRCASRLEAAGVSILYGKAKFKTHAKICLVLREESSGLKYYAHLSTGNYHETTARLYSDVGVFTSNSVLTNDLLALFDVISGCSEKKVFSKVEVAPFGLKAKLLKLICRETELSKKSAGCFIRAKMNSLVDPDVIEALYEASRQGVKIYLNIRGICCLRPGIKGLSETIHVISIVDMFLEHSRIFHFRNGGKDEIYLSSADWMPRNFERRVEIMFPIESEEIKNELIDVLNLYFQDNTKAWKLLPCGSYKKLTKGPNQEFRVQSFLCKQAESKVKTVLKEKAG